MMRVLSFLAALGPLYFLSVSDVLAATNYVSLSGNHVPPFTSWANAATNINAAIDAASASNVVLVASGVYRGEEVVVDRAITLRSANGADVTLIDGDGEHRCLTLQANALVSGFTFTNGDDTYGGGAYVSAGVLEKSCCVGCGASYGGGLAIDGSSCEVRECLVAHNYADSEGGGVYFFGYGGNLKRCRILDNNTSRGGGISILQSAHIENCQIALNNAGNYGGGVYRGSAYFADSTEISGCTIVGNTANDGAGISFDDGPWSPGFLVVNSIVHGNVANLNTNWTDGESVSYAYCFTTPLAGLPDGTGCIDGEPNLVTPGNPHILSSSPCRNVGTNAYALGTDIDNEVRISGGTTDIGCDEFIDAGITGPVSVSIQAPYGTTAVVGCSLEFDAEIEGKVSRYTWSLGDSTKMTNVPVVSHAYGAAGVYLVMLQVSNLSHVVSAALTVTVVSGANSVRYASPYGTHAYPFSSWTSAATNIQDAIDAAPAGGRVLVTNGTYATGTFIKDGIKNRIGICRPLSIESINGPRTAIIVGDGYSTTNAARCAYLESGVNLTGFTLSNGFVMQPYPIHHSTVEDCGAGAYLNAGGTVSNCIVCGNQASRFGGGILIYENGNILNCLIYDNVAWGSYGYGGGVCLYRGGLIENSFVFQNSSCYYAGGVSASRDGTIRGCTIIGNSADVGAGGVRLYSGSTMDNSIVYYNVAMDGDNLIASDHVAASHSCTFPLDALPESVGCISNSPRLLSLSNPHIVSNSPCRNAGTNAVAGGVDIDGELRIASGTVDIGCDEYWANGITGALSVSILTPDGVRAALGYPLAFQADIQGKAVQYLWDLRDGSVITDALVFTHAYSATGAYEVSLSAYNLSQVAETVVTVEIVSADQAIAYVSPSGTHVPPFTAWPAAATNIQDAIDAAVTGGRVLVTNGVYENSLFVTNSIRSRVGVARSVQVESVSGPEHTVIVGSGPTGTTAVRCVYISADRILAGFTLSNGHTTSSGHGGGVYFDRAGTLSNCVITHNTAKYGGGAHCQFGGHIVDCRIQGNSAEGSESEGGGIHIWYAGGADACAIVSNWAAQGGAAHLDDGGELRDSLLAANSADVGGGAYVGYYGTVENTFIIGNAASNGGGAWLDGGVLRSALVVSNAAQDGGGVTFYSGGTLENCTISHNVAANAGGGIYYDYAELIQNCIISENSAPAGTNWYSEFEYIDLEYCCTTPLPEDFFFAEGCIDEDPDFAGSGDYHLARTSPCINAGTNVDDMADWTDLDGNPWISGCWVDMGAYEYQITGAFIRVAPRVLDLGDAIPGETNEGSVRVENGGLFALSGHVTNIEPPFSVIGEGGYTLQTCCWTTITFAFAPYEEGFYTNVVTLTGGGDTELMLTGGIPEPALLPALRSLGEGGIADFSLLIVYLLLKRYRG